MVTAGGLVFRGAPDGNFLALDAQTGEELWRFQTGFGADAPPMTYEVDGEQYVAIATGGNQSERQRLRRRGVVVLPEGAAAGRCGRPRRRRLFLGRLARSPQGWMR